MNHNIFDYFFYRAFKQYVEKEGSYGSYFNAALYVSLVFICITGFIPLNLIKIIFLQHNLLIYLFVILYCISIVTYFVLRYKKYNQRKNRIELFRRYRNSNFNKYFPDWSIWLIGIILCPAGGFFMVWVQKNLLCYLL